MKVSESLDHKAREQIKEMFAEGKSVRTFEHESKWYSIEQKDEWTYKLRWFGPKRPWDDGLKTYKLTTGTPIRVTSGASEFMCAKYRNKKQGEK